MSVVKWNKKCAGQAHCGVRYWGRVVVVVGCGVAGLGGYIVEVLVVLGCLWVGWG